MPPSPPPVLVVAADEHMAARLAARLAYGGAGVHLHVAAGAAALAVALRRSGAGAVLVDPGAIATLAALQAVAGIVPPPAQGMLDRCGVTGRERQVLALLAAGRATGEVAQDLALSRETVRGHVKSALRKLGVRSRTAAVALLVAEGAAPTIGT